MIRIMIRVYNVVLMIIYFLFSLMKCIANKFMILDEKKINIYDNKIDENKRNPRVRISKIREIFIKMNWSQAVWRGLTSLFCRTRLLNN